MDNFDQAHFLGIRSNKSRADAVPHNLLLTSLRYEYFMKCIRELIRRLIMPIGMVDREKIQRPTRRIRFYPRENNANRIFASVRDFSTR